MSTRQFYEWGQRPQASAGKSGCRKKTNTKHLRHRWSQYPYTLLASQYVVFSSVRSHHRRRNGSDVGFPYVSQDVSVAAAVDASRLAGVQKRALVVVVAIFVIGSTSVCLYLLQGGGSAAPGASLSIQGTSEVDDFPERFAEVIRKKGVQDRINARVHVCQDVTHDLYHNSYVGDLVFVGTLQYQDQLQAQNVIHFN